MTGTPPPPEPDTSETPAKAAPDRKKKVRRSYRERARRAARWAGIGLAALIALGVIGLVAGRYFVTTDAGRAQVLRLLHDREIGRFGRLNIDGLSGDLLDEFNIARITVVDTEGVWLEATDIHVAWSYAPLLRRRFHAEEITARKVRLIRRPVLGPDKDEEKRPAPLAFAIDRFDAEVELMEDFSKEYGRWKVSGDANIPRFGVKSASLDAASLNRPGDFLKLAARFGDKPQDLHLDLNALEARGGPLAGSLGYSADQPFMARALVTGNVVDVVVRTGDFQPLHATGRFGDAGSRLSAYVDFSGSDLLAPFITRFGRTARLGFASIPVEGRDDVQTMAWRLTADNIQSSARGLIGTSGGINSETIRLEVTTPSLTRLAGFRIAEAARYEGEFKGSASDFTLTGRVEGSYVDLAGYRMARLAGPLGLSARNGEYTLDGDLAASGGSREGVIGQLLGTAPTVKASVSRLKDGAILMRSIDLRGRAGTLRGSGRRNLLGGLGFDGRVDLSDISALSPAASGSIGGRLRAGNARSGAPWTLDFDGQGRALSTGMEEVDRLLGARPRLSLAGSLNDGIVSITRGRLNGDAGQADVIGQIQGDKLRLRLAWDASGPFGIGPIAIDGKMTGDGTLYGTINQPELALEADFGRVNIGQVVLDQTHVGLVFNRRVAGSNGNITIASLTRGQQVRGFANFGLNNNNISLTNVDVTGAGLEARGDITLSRAVPSRADLTISARPGPFVERGTLTGRLQLTGTEGNARGVVDISASNFMLRGTNVPINRLILRGSGPLSALPLEADVDIGGATPITYRGPLTYARENDAFVLHMGGNPPAVGSIRGIGFRVWNGTHIRMGDNGPSAQVNLGFGGNSTVKATLMPVAQRGRNASRAWNLDADLAHVPVGVFSPNHEGRISGTMDIRNIGLPGLQGQGTLSVANARLAQSRDPGLNATANFQLDANSVAIDFQGRAGGTTNRALTATGNVTLPLDYRPSPLRIALASEGPLRGHLQANGDIKPLWDLIDGIDRNVTGNVSADISVGGQLNSRTIAGAINLNGVNVDDNVTGMKLRDLRGAIALTERDITVTDLRARDGEGRNAGTVQADGRLYFTPSTAGQNASYLNLSLNNFRLADTRQVRMVASGRLRADYTGRSVQLTGTVNVDDARIAPVLPGNTGIVSMAVTEINAPGVSAEPAAAGTRQRTSIPIILDVTVRAPEIEVRGEGIDMMLEAQAQVAGSISNPRLTGFAEVVRGTYEFAGKRFAFDPGGRVTLDTSPQRIMLDLVARREDPTITAIIRATGSVAEPRIVLSSEPELPQDEILARVLFGRSISQLSPIEAAQLASAVASLAGGGDFNVLGQLRRLSGLDSLSFSGDAANLMVAGGRRLTDDIYLEVIGGGEAGTTVNVEWQVRNNIAVSAGAGGDGNAVISVRWRKVSD